MIRFTRFLCAAYAVLFAAPLSLFSEYAKPDPAKAFPDFKVYDSAGRPWRTAREDWAGAKKRVAEDPSWKEWLEKQRAEVDHWMSKPRDRVEWAAGWSHDGVSPKDASRLIWTEEVPREDVQFFHSASDPQVPITPKTFAWWVVSTRGRNFSMIGNAARLYRLSGDKKYADWAAGQIDFYADNFLKWAPARDGARLFWQTLTEASNLVTLTEAVRNLGSSVAPDRLNRWRDELFFPEVKVLNNSYQNIHNIACWQRAAAAQVALLFRDDAMWKEALDGPHGVRAQIREGVTSDYLWHEQSFGYNGFVVRALSTLFETAGIYGRAEELDYEMTVAENLLLSTTYYRFPNGQLPNPADSGGIGKVPTAQALGAYYRVFPTTPGLTAAADAHTWDTLLDPPPPSPRPVGPLPPVVSRSLETTRMAILKHDPWQVFFHYGQLTRSHTESEALNYSAAFGTTDITHDPGTVGYGSPLHRGYHTRGLGHNVVLVDGEGEDLGAFTERREWVVEQPNLNSPLRGELLGFSSDPARVSAAQPYYRRNAKAKRTLKIDGQRLTDVASVETTDGQTHRLGLALHLQGAVKLPDTFVRDENFAEKRPEPFQYWRDARKAAFHDRVEFDVNYGQVVMHIVIACPGDLTVWHASSPDVPPKRRESLYVETTGKAATFTTTFTPAE
ncbi:MAG TPA: heparinase II/III family protein [Opitutaceae bacterium]|nr:heparinase II/III family protein [Opitutaceae bacterium]